MGNRRVRGANAAVGENCRMNAAQPTGRLRRILERLLGRIVLVRRLPAEYGGGRLVVSARVGGLKYVFKSPRHWDPELLRIAALLVRPGDRVWDVGANVGLFSLAARHHAGAEGEVLAIEADNDAASLLFATARRGPPGLTVLPIAVGCADGFVRFAIARRARAANAIEGYGSTQTGGVRELRILPSRSLDSLLEHFAPPAVLKIDVEGAEMAVLRGAIRLLREFGPRIYCEVTGQTRAEATALLKSFGYVTYDGESFGTEGAHDVQAGTCNLVAIAPRESEALRHET